MCDGNVVGSFDVGNDDGIEEIDGDEVGNKLGVVEGFFEAEGNEEGDEDGI